MKKIILFFLVLLFVTNIFSQQIKNSPLTASEYLHKSRNQKTIGWILAGGGSALFLTGCAMYPKDFDWLFGTTPEKEGQANTATGLILIGSASVLSSIPLFIAAKKNERRGINLSFKNESVPQIQNSSFVNTPVPALSLKISL